MLFNVKEPLLRIDQVAELIGVTPGTLLNWRSQGRGPTGYKLGVNGAVRYRREDVDNWLNECREVGA